MTESMRTAERDAGCGHPSHSNPDHDCTPFVTQEHGYGETADCVCGRNFLMVRGLREHLTKSRLALAKEE